MVAGENDDGVAGETAVFEPLHEPAERPVNAGKSRWQSRRLHQVADHTKIRTDHVRALEEGQFGAFSATVYIRGSVKIYAKLLKLDEAKLLATLEGIWVEPASAAGLAGLAHEIAAGTFQPGGKRIVAICTGHGLKDPDIVIKDLAKPRIVAPNMDALMEVLSA